MKLINRDEIRLVWGSLKVDVFTTRFFVDPIAVPLVILFSKIKGMTPNKVSVLALLAGTIAMFMFLTSHYYLGALWYYIFFVFDCIDGKLARFTSTFDTLGGFYDFVIDRMVITAMSFGFVISLIRVDLDLPALWGGIYIIIFLLKDVFELKWKESLGDMNNGANGAQRSGIVYKLCERYKIHFKPGQILSCFVVFIIGPLSGKYLECFFAGSIFVLLSICASTIVPYVRYLQRC